MIPRNKRAKLSSRRSGERRLNTKNIYETREKDPDPVLLLRVKFHGCTAQDVVRLQGSFVSYEVVILETKKEHFFI